jgi:hypothetical protein
VRAHCVHAGQIAYPWLYVGVSACETYVDGLMASTFFRAERFGRLRSYFRPGGAAHMSAGPDEVRRPESLSDLRASSSCLMATVSFIASQCACQTSNCDLCNCSVICLQERRRPYAFANISARKISPVLIIAQMIRASLLASATVTRRAGLFARSALIQSASACSRYAAVKLRRARAVF